jgi:hypothetical protein
MFDLIKAPQDTQLIVFRSTERRSLLLFRGTFLVNLTMVTDLEKEYPGLHRQILFRGPGKQLGCGQITSR